jgi:sugar/nucleoside kinase (ribokinase family)
LGPDGAFAVVGDRPVAVDGVNAAAVVDTTGAGDLFAAALAWADLMGADPEVALAWANLYAGLSVGSHTGIGGAVTRDQLIAEGERRGLPPLPA